MRKVLVFLCSILLVIGAAGVVGAQYVETPVLTVDGSVAKEDLDRWIIWEHSLESLNFEGCPGCLSLSLEIVADDVDADKWYGQSFQDGEDDEVFIYQGEGDPNQNPGLFQIKFDNVLTDYGDQSLTVSFIEEPGVGGDKLSTTGYDVLTIMCSDLDFVLDFQKPLYVGVLVEGNGDLNSGADDWDVEIETSQLRINCVPIPSALLLLGSGVIGLVGLRRKFK